MKANDYGEPRHNDILGRRLASIPGSGLPQGLENAIMEKVRAESGRMKRIGTAVSWAAIAAGIGCAAAAGWLAIAFTDTDVRYVVGDVSRILADTVRRIVTQGRPLLPLFSGAALLFSFYAILNTILKRYDIKQPVR